MDQEELFVMEAEDVTAPFCICIVIACMLAAVFLFPRITIDSPLVHPQVPIVPELAMVGTKNPFTIEILNPGLASVKDGIKLVLKTSVDSELHALWMVDCSSLQQALQERGTQLLRDVPSRLGDHCLHLSSPVLLAAETETDIALTLPDTVTNTQIQASTSPPPRTKYPLCLVIRAAHGENQREARQKIVGAMYIFHLPDDTFRDHCHLISHLIISDTGQVCDLQKLYMATDGMCTSQNATESVASGSQPEDALTRDCTENAGTIRDRRTNSERPENGADVHDTVPNGCVVCQNGSVSIALLPCRHTCVCSLCFPLINACPMCRGCIESFFLLNGHGAGSDRGRVLEAENEAVEGDDWPARFSHSCERLNRWLGMDN